MRIAMPGGARPNFVKIAALDRALRRNPAVEPLFINTGQHYDWEMAAVFLRDLDLPDPVVDLGVGSGSHAEQTARVMLQLEPVLTDLKPDMVLVVGDVNSTVAAALTAAKLQIPVGHVEAGLRSRDATMPEEINRIATDAISDLLFAPSADAADNLRSEGHADDAIHLVGNVMIDTLDRLLTRVLDLPVLERFELKERGYAVVTLHRPSNVDEEVALMRTALALKALASVTTVVFPVHPRTRERLRASDAGAVLSGDQRIRLIDPLGYPEFLALEARAAAVITDSGGVQEETTVLGVPCLTARTTTERPITITEGTNRLTSLEPDVLVTAFEDAVRAADYEPRRPALWDGHAAERIADVILDRFDQRPTSP